MRQKYRANQKREVERAEKISQNKDWKQYIEEDYVVFYNNLVDVTFIGFKFYIQASGYSENDLL